MKKIILLALIILGSCSTRKITCTCVCEQKQPQAQFLNGTTIHIDTVKPFSPSNFLRFDGISQKHQGGIIEYHSVDSFNLMSSDNGGIIINN